MVSADLHHDVRVFVFLRLTKKESPCEETTAARVTGCLVARRYWSAALSDKCEPAICLRLPRTPDSCSQTTQVHLALRKKRKDPHQKEQIRHQDDDSSSSPRSVRRGSAGRHRQSDGHGERADSGEGRRL